MTHGLRWTNQEYEAYRRRMDGLAPPVTTIGVGASIRREADRLYPDHFMELCAAAGLPMPAREVLLIPGRDFRFDYAWPLLHIAVEQQGFRDHSTRKGLARDYEKLNLAQSLNWKVYQFTPKQLQSVDTIEWLRVQLSRVE
jgi:hypothetical protein